MTEATSERTGLTTKAVKQQSLSEATATAYARAAPLGEGRTSDFHSFGLYLSLSFLCDSAPK